MSARDDVREERQRIRDAVTKITIRAIFPRDLQAFCGGASAAGPLGHLIGTSFGTMPIQPMSPMTLTTAQAKKASVKCPVRLTMMPVIQGEMGPEQFPMEF